MDLADPPAAMREFIREMHAFNCDWFRAFAATDVDGLGIADDWGSQRALLISPAMWREYFKPLYRDYVQIAHAQRRVRFMARDANKALQPVNAESGRKVHPPQQSPPYRRAIRGSGNRVRHEP